MADQERLYLHQLACEVAFRILTADQPALALARFCDDLADEVAAGQQGLGDTEFLRAAFRDAIGYSTRVDTRHRRGRSVVTRTHTYTRTFDRFLLDDSLPERIVVREVTPEGHATRLYAVVADHGWAERILAGDCYRRDANDLAFAAGELLDIPVEEEPDRDTNSHSQTEQA